MVTGDEVAKNASAGQQPKQTEKRAWNVRLTPWLCLLWCLREAGAVCAGEGDHNAESGVAAEEHVVAAQIHKQPAAVLLHAAWAWQVDGGDDAGATQKHANAVRAGEHADAPLESIHFHKVKPNPENNENSRKRHHEEVWQAEPEPLLRHVQECVAEIPHLHVGPSDFAMQLRRKSFCSGGQSDVHKAGHHNENHMCNNIYRLT